MHQYIRCQRGVSSSPPEASVSITNAPESAEVTKKTPTSRIASDEVKPAAGRYSRNLNSAVDRFSCTARAMPPAATPRSSEIAVLPNTVIHRKVKAVGTNSTPMTNSRIVRPREMRAMNMPTKGDQAIHHAQ